MRDALPHFSTPIVVKADGLAAGKGVVIAKTKDEAATIANEMLSGHMLGEAGARVVLEEFLQGDELSFLVVSDGERIAPLVAAQDHKRVAMATQAPTPAAWVLTRRRPSSTTRCETGWWRILRGRWSPG